MALRAPTQWNRTTLQKASAFVVSPADVDGPEGSYRKIKLVMRSGIAAFAIFENGVDANDVIAGSRTNEWAEVDADVAIPHFELMPNQVLWGVVAQTLAQASGIAHVSVMIEFHDGGGR